MIELLISMFLTSTFSLYFLNYLNKQEKDNITHEFLINSKNRYNI